VGPLLGNILLVDVFDGSEVSTKEGLMPVPDRRNVAAAIDRHVPHTVFVANLSVESEPRPVPEKVVSVLAVSPFEDDHLFLRNIFSHSKWRISGVQCWREALDYLSERRTAVVICERDLPDSDWKKVLVELSSMPDSPLLIVTSRSADDHLWAEVLNLGGYDVLMKPFETLEVVRVVSLAWLNWKTGLERQRREAASRLVAVAS